MASPTHIECNFCKKILSSKGNLDTHQKTTKYCLDLQGKIINCFTCNQCGKNFTSHQNQLNHACEKNKKKLEEIQLIEDKKKEEETKLLNEFSKKFEREIEQLKERLSDKDAFYKDKMQERDLYHQKDLKVLEEKIQEKNEYIAKLESRLDKFENAVTTMATEPKTKTTTTTNVVVNNNTLNLSPEHVAKVLDDHFTKEVVAGGQKGLANMVCEKMLKGVDGKLTYKCVDPSRHTFEFINEEGCVERDVKAKKLTKALIKGKVQQKASSVGNTIWTKADGRVDTVMYEYSSPNVMELACFERDDSKFRSELSALTS